MLRSNSIVNQDILSRIENDDTLAAGIDQRMIHATLTDGSTAVLAKVEGGNEIGSEIENVAYAISPSITVTQEEYGYRITITDRDGTQEAVLPFADSATIIDTVNKFLVDHPEYMTVPLEEHNLDPEAHEAIRDMIPEEATYAEVDAYLNL